MNCLQNDLIDVVDVAKISNKITRKREHIPVKVG
jgi:hypothetical protein